MVCGWNSPSSFLSVIHNTWNRPRPASTYSKSTYELLFESFKDVSQVRKGNERIIRVVQSYGDRDNKDYFPGIGYNINY